MCEQECEWPWGLVGRRQKKGYFFVLRLVDKDD